MYAGCSTNGETEPTFKELLESDFDFENLSYRDLYNRFQELEFKPVGTEVTWQRSLAGDLVALGVSIENREIILSVYDDWAYRTGKGYRPPRKEVKDRLKRYLEEEYGSCIYRIHEIVVLGGIGDPPLIEKTLIVPTWELPDRRISLLEYDSDGIQGRLSILARMN